MEPGLAAKFPGIKTYRGRGIDDPMASLHLDVNPRTLSRASPVALRHLLCRSLLAARRQPLHELRENDLSAGGRKFKCLAENGQPETTRQRTPTWLRAAPNNAMSGKNLRTYRLACATSIMYCQYHGGPNPDVALVLAALVTMNNRVSGVYETELGIRMVLVADQKTRSSRPQQSDALHRHAGRHRFESSLHRPKDRRGEL